MRITYRYRGRRAGFSLVELMISLLVLSMVLGMAGMVATGGSNAYRQAEVQSDVEVRARRALDRAADELALAGVDTLLPAGQVFDNDELRFNQARGYAGGVVIWGPAMRLGVDYEQGEFDDGLDNDGDGLIDEGELVLVQNEGGPGEQRVVLCHGVREFLEGETFDGDDENGNGLVDERGFSVERAGNLLILRLTVEKTDVQGDRAVRTVETSVEVRN